MENYSLFLHADASILLPTVQLTLQNDSTFLVDVHNMTVEDYNLTIVSLFHSYTRITSNNQISLQ